MQTRRSTLPYTPWSEKDADMKAMFERTVAIPVKYEMLTCARGGRTCCWQTAIGMAAFPRR